MSVPAQAIVASRRRALVRRRGAHALIHAVILVGAVFTMVPFVWMLTASIKHPDEIFTYPPTWIPRGIRYENWVESWQAVDWARYFFNSALMAVSISLSHIVLCSLAAYGFARTRFPGRDPLFMAFLATMMVPGQVLLIPQFIMMRWFGWVDTYWALIIPSIGSAYGTFMLRQFFLQIPFELEDAARIDGCNRLQILYRIIVPLSVPAMTTLAVFSFMAAWNAFVWPLIVTNSQSMFTVQLGLSTFRGAYGNVDWGKMMAATCFITLPVIGAFLAGQRQFIEGITMTGMKG
jgi:multiple sugar transport system permease protein